MFTIEAVGTVVAVATAELDWFDGPSAVFADKSFITRNHLNHGARGAASSLEHLSQV